jgi:tripartite ATP-independent transporter DctM subunit
MGEPDTSEARIAEHRADEAKARQNDGQEPLELVAVDSGVPTSPPGGWSGAVWLDRALEGILTVALIGELVVLLVNIFARALLGFSVLWTQEIAQLALTTIAFIGGAIAYPKGAHTSVEAVVMRLPRSWRPAFAALVDSMVLAMGVGGFLLSLPTLQNHWIERTPILQLRVFWLALPLTVGMFLIGYFALRRLWTQPRRTVFAMGGAVVAVIAFLLLSNGWIVGSLSPGGLLMTVLLVLLVLLVVGLPIGFVLAIDAALYLYLGGGTSAVAVPLGMERGANSFILLAVPFFILAGALMNGAGLTRPLARFVESFIGHRPGGLLHVGVLTMYIFSGISGSKVADVAAVGTTMRRMLDERGYKPGESVAVLSASAIMGETIPPSIAMLVLGSITTVSISALFVAGLVPAAVLGVCILALIYVRARGFRVGALARASWGERGSLTIKALPTLVLPVGLVGGILLGVATPTEISSVAVLYALLLAVVVFRAMSGRLAWRTFADAATMAGMVLFIIAAATPFAQTLTLAGVPQQIANGMSQLGGSKALFLLATIVTLIIMGQLLEGLPALLIFGPLLVPLAPQFGVDPLQYGLVLIFAMGLGSFAPPVGVGFYVTCSVIGTTFEKSVRPFVPYFIVLFIGLLLVAFFPFFSLILPDLLHIGSSS